MNFDRCRFSLNVLEESLIAVGGHHEGFQRLDDQIGSNVATVEKYDPASDSWTMLTPLPEFRSQHAGATYKNKLFISGGIDGYGSVLNSFYEYDSSTHAWTKICNLTPRADHVMLRLGMKIFICGGWQEIDGHRRFISAIKCYDINTSSINVITHVHTPRYHAGITMINNRIYFIGGFAADGNVSNLKLNFSWEILILDIFRHTATKIEVYDIIEDKWYFPEKYPKHIWEHILSTIYIPKDRVELISVKLS